MPRRNINADREDLDKWRANVRCFKCKRLLEARDRLRTGTGKKGGKVYECLGCLNDELPRGRRL